MRIFARVVEAGTFTRAADSLQMPKASVTKNVQALEERLRVTLLNRTTRRVTVTADGAAFYDRTVRLLADFDDIEASMSQARATPRGRLRVDVFPAGHIVPAFGVMEAVSTGAAEMGHTASFFWDGQLPGAAFFTPAPFGMSPLGHQTWIEQRGGQRPSRLNRRALRLLFESGDQEVDARLQVRGPVHGHDLK
jgi:TRAP-type mannitol/chloroaromatic compound transport system substrate-binding protein